MELKDVILSTLAEMEDDTLQTPSVTSRNSEIIKVETEATFEPKMTSEEVEEQLSPVNQDSELIYLSSIRERLLVLFEGFQAPNNTNIEAKVDMTLNFLEYTLATIDERVQKLEKGKL